MIIAALNDKRDYVNCVLPVKWRTSTTSCLSVRVIDTYDFNIYLFSLPRDQICTHLHYYPDKQNKKTVLLNLSKFIYHAMCRRTPLLN